MHWFIVDGFHLAQSMKMEFMSLAIGFIFGIFASNNGEGLWLIVKNYFSYYVHRFSFILWVVPLLG
jgi:hypothetical protein